METMAELPKMIRFFGLGCLGVMIMFFLVILVGFR